MPMHGLLHVEFCAVASCVAMNLPFCRMGRARVEKFKFVEHLDKNR